MTDFKATGKNEFVDQYPYLTYSEDPESINDGGGSGTLPIASAETLGGVKIGDGLTITDAGVLSTETLPVASTETLGGVKVGNGLDTAEDGTLSVAGGGGNTFVMPVHWAWVDSGFKPSTTVTNDEIKAAYTASKAVLINNDSQTYPATDTIPARWNCTEFEVDINKTEIIWLNWNWESASGIPTQRYKYSVETSKFYKSDYSGSSWGSWVEY